MFLVAALRNSPRGAPGRPAELSIASPSLPALLRPPPHVCPRLLGSARAPQRIPASSFPCSRCPPLFASGQQQREREGAAGVWVSALPPLTDSGDTLCPLGLSHPRSFPAAGMPRQQLLLSPPARLGQGFLRALPRGEDVQISPRAPFAGGSPGKGQIPERGKPPALLSAPSRSRCPLLSAAKPGHHHGPRQGLGVITSGSHPQRVSYPQLDSSMRFLVNSGKPVALLLPVCAAVLQEGTVAGNMIYYPSRRSRSINNLKV